MTEYAVGRASSLLRKQIQQSANIEYIDHTVKIQIQYSGIRILHRNGLILIYKPPQRNGIAHGNRFIAIQITVKCRCQAAAAYFAEDTAEDYQASWDIVANEIEYRTSGSL